MPKQSQLKNRTLDPTPSSLLKTKPNFIHGIGTFTYIWLIFYGKCMVKYIITWILCPYLVDFSDTNMDPMASKCDFSAFHPSAFGLWTIGSWASAIHLFELFAWAGWTVQIQRKKTCWIHLGVSKNRGTPKSSILIGFSIINHPFWGTPIFGNTHMGFYHQSFNVTIETTKSWQFCEKTWPF